MATPTRGAIVRFGWPMLDGETFTGNDEHTVEYEYNGQDRLVRVDARLASLPEGELEMIPVPFNSPTLILPMPISS